MEMGLICSCVLSFYLETDRSIRERIDELLG